MPFISLVFAIVAIISQPVTPPDTFTAGLKESTPIMVPGTFMGREWKCGDENCYAGFIWVTDSTGHTTVVPTTGP